MAREIVGTPCVLGYECGDKLIGFDEAKKLCKEGKNVNVILEYHHELKCDCCDTVLDRWTTTKKCKVTVYYFMKLY